MKKALAGIFITAVVLSLFVGTIGVFAAGPEGGRGFMGTGCSNICDPAGNTCSYFDANNDGICDNCGASLENGTNVYGAGKNFVDANGDGICDNYTTGCHAGLKNSFHRGCSR